MPRWIVLMRPLVLCIAMATIINLQQAYGELHKTHLTSFHDAPCDDQCAKGRWDYYWCNTSKGSDYCSPATNMDYKNRPCKKDSPCDKHGAKFNWCYLKNGSWGYCGKIEEKQVKQWFDKGNRICTTLELNENKKIADGTPFKSDITNIINKWQNKLLTDRAVTLVKTENFRIDMQGMVNKSGQLYHNLQIQHNVLRQNRRSTTYALVLVPKNVPVTERYVRHAFIKSLEDQCEVQITVVKCEK